MERAEEQPISMHSNEDAMRRDESEMHRRHHPYLPLLPSDCYFVYSFDSASRTTVRVSAAVVSPLPCLSSALRSLAPVRARRHWRRAPTRREKQRKSGEESWNWREYSENSSCENESEM